MSWWWSDVVGIILMNGIVVFISEVGVVMKLDTGRHVSIKKKELKAY